MGYYYALLGVTPAASTEEVNAAYLAARESHPPSSKSMAWLRRMRLKDLEKAYQVLSDPQARAVYDAQLEENIRMNMGMPPPA